MTNTSIKPMHLGICVCQEIVPCPNTVWTRDYFLSKHNFVRNKVETKKIKHQTTFLTSTLLDLQHRE